MPIPVAVHLLRRRTHLLDSSAVVASVVPAAVRGRRGRSLSLQPCTRQHAFTCLSFTHSECAGSETNVQSSVLCHTLGPCGVRLGPGRGAALDGNEGHLSVKADVHAL